MYLGISGGDESSTSNTTVALAHCTMKDNNAAGCAMSDCECVVCVGWLCLVKFVASASSIPICVPHTQSR